MNKCPLSPEEYAETKFKIALGFKPLKCGKPLNHHPGSCFMPKGHSGECRACVHRKSIGGLYYYRFMDNCFGHVPGTGGYDIAYCYCVGPMKE